MVLYSINYSVGEETDGALKGFKERGLILGIMYRGVGRVLDSKPTRDGQVPRTTHGYGGWREDELGELLPLVLKREGKGMMLPEPSETVRVETMEQGAPDLICP